MALVVADLYALGLTVVRSKIGFLIGSATALFVIISYAGFTLGFACTFDGLRYSGWQGLFAGVVFVCFVIQVLYSIVITPKLVGAKVG